MSLYNKYRPQTFDQIYGNSEVVEYLQDALKDLKTCPHVFLLHGPTGCGKTTLARIVAEELRCSEVDVQEINTANFRGIDTIREIIKNSRYKSLEGDNRIWIIDEAHKITSDAQNALLKLLEDPPAHTYFTLCTTEPNKLLNTIRGRCIGLQVNPLSERQMFRLLRGIVKSEGKRLGKNIYDQIIRDSLGLPRNGIQILERVLGVSEEKQLKAAQQSAEEYSQSIELCRALIQRQPWKKVAKILSGLKEQDAESIRRHVLGYCQSVLLKGKDNRAAQVIEEFWEPLYNTGHAGLVYCCYAVING